MFQTIKKISIKPTIYKKSDAKFWDDPYISQNMLQAHLNPDLESATRKLDFVQQSADWISNVLPAAKYKRLIDLGCGPGIYTELFCLRGYQVTGIDLSENSVQYAEKSAVNKNLSIKYQSTDYIQAPIYGEYDLATMIYCDFGVLSNQDRKILLQKICNSLSSNGCFLFDVYTPNAYKNREEFKTWSFEEKGFWRNNPYLLLHSLYRYDYDNTFLNQYIVATEGETTCYNIWEHTFVLDELQADLQEAGFTNIQFYGNVAGAPYDSNSNTLCVIAAKQQF